MRLTVNTMNFALICNDGSEAELAQMQPVDGGQRCRLVIESEQLWHSTHEHGLLIVEDRSTRQRYGGQLLHAEATEHQCILTCVPFGELTGPQSQTGDDDFLVLPDGTVVSVHRWMYAVSQCMRGPHYRIECATRDWQNLPYGLGQDYLCACAQCRTKSHCHAVAYRFQPLRSTAKDAWRRPPRVELVRLRTRERFLIDLEHAAVDGEVMLIMGHVTGRVLWPSSGALKKQTQDETQRNTPGRTRYSAKALG